MDGHRPVAVPGSALDTARGGRYPRVLDRDDELDQTLAEPQAMHHLDAHVLHRDVAFMLEAEHIAIESQHGLAIRGDDAQIDCVLRDFDSHGDLLLSVRLYTACGGACAHVVAEATWHSPDMLLHGLVGTLECSEVRERSSCPQ